MKKLGVALFWLMAMSIMLSITVAATTLTVPNSVFLLGTGGDLKLNGYAMEDGDPIDDPKPHDTVISFLSTKEHS
jgi:hypothetical protein